MDILHVCTFQGNFIFMFNFWLVISDYIVCMRMLLMTSGQQLVGISTGPVGFPLE